MLSLEVDDSEKQTKRILRKVAETEGYNRTLPKADYEPWKDFQRHLAAGERRVTIPFAKTLGRMMGSTKSVRLRRDFGQLLRAIKAHALLHRAHRDHDEDGAIKATLEDYAVVRDLMADLLAAASELKISEVMAQTIAVVEDFQFETEEDEARERSNEGVTVRQVAEVLNLDRSAAQRRLYKAASDGFVINLEDRQGRPARYKTTDEAPIEGAALLPTPDEVRSEIRRSKRSKKSHC
jgi:hypothetical protein